MLSPYHPPPQPVTALMSHSAEEEVRDSEPMGQKGVLFAERQPVQVFATFLLHLIKLLVLMCAWVRSFPPILLASRAEIEPRASPVQGRCPSACHTLAISLS